MLAADDLLVALLCQKHMPKGAAPAHRRPREGGHKARPPGILYNPGGYCRTSVMAETCTKPKGGLECGVLGGDGDRRRNQSSVPR